MNTTSHNPESPLHIVFASDQRFLRQLTVASTSAVYASRTSGGSICIHVLDCGIEDPSWTDYAALVDRVATKANVTVSLVRHRIDMTLFAKFGSWNSSKATWARLLIPDLLPDADRCIYSDCDMLFVADPREMLDALNDPNILLAGHHEPMQSLRHPDDLWCEKHGVEFDAETNLCAGLLAMNLSAFRAENLVEKCFAFATENPDVPFRDQTTLNRVCLGRKTLLPDGWGLFVFECHACGGRIKAIHYGGGLWPWTNVSDYQKLAWLTLAKEAHAIWLDFETCILGLSLPGATKPDLRLRLLASGLLLLDRIATRLGIQVGKGRLQAGVVAHDRKTPALANARREVFGDKQA